MHDDERYNEHLRQWRQGVDSQLKNHDEQISLLHEAISIQAKDQESFVGWRNDFRSDFKGNMDEIRKAISDLHRQRVYEYIGIIALLSGFFIWYIQQI